MCFSKEVSLGTFITGVIGGLLCVSTGIPDYKIIGFFMIFISLMQGIEYLLWEHQECDTYNKTVSYIGMILNHLQPIVLFLLVTVYSKSTKLNLILILIYTLVIIEYSSKYINDCTVKSKGSLYWKWNYLNYNYLVYTLFLITIISLGSNLTKYGNLFNLFVFISYILSLIIYGSTKMVGSMWCFFSAFGGLFFYTLLKMKVV